MERIYLSPPHMGGEELGLVGEAFDSNWLAPLGPQVDAFEQEFAEAVGASYAVALSSGTAALHLALQLAGVGKGDTVVCSTLTFAATAFAVTYLGGRPLFVDCDPATWNMDPELLARAVEADGGGKAPAAVVVVDLYGQSADYDRILPICAERGIPMIEDAAEALGATYRGRPAGTFGRAGVYSFNGNKIITTSGGGMLVSEDAALVDRARYLATQARDPAPHYQHSAIGYNYRMSNVLAAIGRGQLRVLADRVTARRRIFDAYVDLLGDLPGIEFMPEAPYGRATRWLTCLTIDPHAFGADREDVRRGLEAENIEARPVWKPLHLQPVFSGGPVVGGAVSERLFERGLCLPSGSALEQADLERIAVVVRSLCRTL